MNDSAYELDEKAVVEGILGDNTAFYDLDVEKNYFRESWHREAFSAIEKILNTGLDATIITLAEHIGASKAAGYSAQRIPNIAYYAKRLRERYRREYIISLAKDIGSWAANEEPDTVIDRAMTELLKANIENDSGLVQVSNYAHETISRIEKKYREKSTISGISTGYKKIDSILDGFRASEFAVLAARTSVGKTAFALNMALNMALNGTNTGVFSCEMSHEEIMDRFTSGLSHIRHQNIRKGLVTESDFTGLTDAMGKIYSLPLWIDDTPNIRFERLRNESRAFRGRGGEVIIIDYLTLVKYGDPNTPRHERVGMLSAELKALARELQIPVIALSQLNRQGEGAAGSMVNIRQSGEIEENADVIMILHRDRESSETSLRIVKHRNGPTGSVDLSFDADTLLFTESELY